MIEMLQKKKDCKLHFGVRTTKEKDNHEDRKCQRKRSADARNVVFWMNKAIFR